MTDNFFKKHGQDRLEREGTSIIWDVDGPNFTVEELYQAIKARRNEEIREKIRQLEAETIALGEDDINMLQIFVKAVLSD
ncbi:MAG: hypothetical protein MJA83_10325 [Gammaproteobacteria bacterium]|nr:hypothetical protein [Gammaproteobacteria bacterium]